MRCLKIPIGGIKTGEHFTAKVFTYVSIGHYLILPFLYLFSPLHLQSQLKTKVVPVFLATPDQQEEKSTIL